MSIVRADPYDDPYDYANGPIMELCRKNNWDFMTVLRDESLPSVWERDPRVEKVPERQPLHRNNVHSRCNLGARHRWGIETGFLVEKHHGYQYEHCFSYDWVAMRGYHYLMRLGHALNILAHYSHALANHVRDLGARGLIEFARNSIAGLWLKAEDFQRIASAAFQIRLE